jgi:hypothetical protein
MNLSRLSLPAAARAVAPARIAVGDTVELL